MNSITEIEQKLKQVKKGDFYRFRQQLRRIKNASKEGKPFDRNLDRLNQSIEKSIQQLEDRKGKLPKIRYENELPVLEKKEEIIQAIRENQVVIICGETGSGKSTQLPKICLEMGRGIHGMIGHTQPRRIAARSVASRIAEELGSAVGTDVGFKIRFHDHTQQRTYIKLMTDGILLAETESDSFLNQYDTIIIDEAHERSLNIDFLLGYLHRIIKKRRDLRVIITSATIDASRFSEHFTINGNPVPVIEVSGRTYPVEVRYRPLEKIEGEKEPDVYSAISDAVDEAAQIDQGDILIFMPTEREIREVSRKLKGNRISGDGHGKKTEIIPLYGRLSMKEQNRVFQTGSSRRIVIATNVAESSLTVPGIRYVIDTGTARISRFSARSQVQRLPIEAISRASADQRKGRCGRIGPGVCFRLYSEEDYQNREEFISPEILRTNLASVILKCIALRLGSIEEFPFLEPPKPAGIRTGYKTLFELQAIDEKQKLTKTGKQLSRMPVDPRTGRMILAGANEHCLSDVLIIAAVLELQDPRERPVDQQEKADHAQEKFKDEESDFVSFLNLWDFYHDQKGKLSRNQLRKSCQQNFLSYNRMREWGDIHRQLMELSEQMGLKIIHAKRDHDSIHRALLTGLLSNIAYRGETFEYTGSGGQKLFLWPGSGLFEKKPKWIMAAELVETNKRYSRVVTKIQPGWIEPVAKHLVQKSYSDPHWNCENSATMAFEKVTLFGMTIVPRRKIRYGNIDPIKSRELMIQNGLVEGDFETKAPFFNHNQDLLQKLESLKAKSRKGDFLLGEEAIYEFYDNKIPQDVFDGHRLNRWLKEISTQHPRLLFMSQTDLVKESNEEVGEEEFPAQIMMNQMNLPLEYHLEPGSDKDGVTILVPQEGVAQLDSKRLDWLIPGMIEQKVIALLKSLPKSIRRMLVPIPDTTKEVLELLQFGKGDMKESVVRALRKITNEIVSVDEFDDSRIPDHLKMNIRILDSAGKEISQGRNLKQIQQKNVQNLKKTEPMQESVDWNRDNVVDWDLKKFPEYFLMERNEIQIKAFPTLIDKNNSVSICLLYDLEQSRYETFKGIRRLFYLKSRRKIMSQVDWLPGLDQVQLLGSTVKGFQAKEQLGLLIAERAFLMEKNIPRSETEFQDMFKIGENRISVAVQDVSEFIVPLFENYHQIRLELEKLDLPVWKTVTEDLWSQLNLLVYPEFLTRTEWRWLLQLPRYLDGMKHRLDKLKEGGFQKDQKAFQQLKPYLILEKKKRSEYDEMDSLNSHLEKFHWMLEEYRISLFAQKLGTALSISPGKLDEQWNRID
jgi:ATP-dependent RNA helicase HrpA